MDSKVKSHGNGSDGTYTVSPAEIAERVRARIRSYGLEPAVRDFEAMERLMSGMEWWPETKYRVEALFAKERRLEQEAGHKAELERARASAPTIYQLMPSAMTGVSGQQPTVVQSIRESHVFNGNISNSDFHSQKGDKQDG